MTTIDIMFLGLIAFVPDSSDTLKAYIVSDANHAPTIKIYGVGLQVENPDLFDCIRGSDGKSVQCDLVDANIVIPQLVKQGKRLQRTIDKDKPSNSEEKEALDWVVRMKDVDPDRNRIIQNADTRRGKVGDGFHFGWTSARVCTLDGEELIENDVSQVPRVVFINENEARPRQSRTGARAVAESILFSSSVKSGEVEVVLQHRTTTNSRTTIKTNCKPEGGSCLGVVISNKFMHEKCEKEKDGDHFLKYYDVLEPPEQLEQSGPRKRPYRIEGRSCDEASGPPPDQSCWEDILRHSESRKSSRPFVAKNKAKVQDRIVCPPVLLEP